MRVAIAGGSLGGLFAAALLGRAGHEVCLFERSHNGLAGRGAGLVPQQEVFDILAAVDRAQVAETGVVARERATLDRSGAVVRRDPYPQMQVSWDALYLAMRSTIDDGSYRLGATVEAAGQDGDGAWLRLHGGERIDVDLVIGADGIGSTVRRAFAGGNLEAPTYAGYVAWRFLLPETALPAISAETLSERFAFFHMPGGQALGYLVAGPAGETSHGLRRYNCVWYRRVADLAALLVDKDGRPAAFSLPPGAVPTAVRERLVEDAYSLLPPAFAAVVAAEPMPFVQAIFDMRTSAMAEHRLVLLGDAAFVARPHTAMGVAKAAGDAMTLAAALDGRDLPAALIAYELARTRVGNAVVDLGRRLGAAL